MTRLQLGLDQCLKLQMVSVDVVRQESYEITVFSETCLSEADFACLPSDYVLKLEEDVILDF